MKGWLEGKAPRFHCFHAPNLTSHICYRAGDTSHISKKLSSKLLEEGDSSPFFLQKVSFSEAFVKFLNDSDQVFCPLSVIPIALNLTNEPREKRWAYTDLSKIQWYRYASAGGHGVFNTFKMDFFN